MDRLVHTALNSISNLRDQRTVSANNLANMNVPGFRRDLPNEGRAFFVESEDSFALRAMQLEKGPHAFASSAGFLDQTGQTLDIAIADKGFFYIQPETGGDPALSRRGDLHVAADGRLTNGAGDQLLSDGLQPITVPPFRNLVVDDGGFITIEPLDGAPGETVQIARLATVVPTDQDLAKGADGQIRKADNTLPPPNGGARVLQGVLEGSNVNSTEELVASIDLQRTFEINHRMIKTAQELDEAGSRLLRMPEG